MDKVKRRIIKKIKIGRRREEWGGGNKGEKNETPWRYNLVVFIMFIQPSTQHH